MRRRDRGLPAVHHHVLRQHPGQRARRAQGVHRLRPAPRERLGRRRLGDWVQTNVQFPNSMVDRITPATTDQDRADIADRFGIDDGWPVVCEPFTQWVLEDHFVTDRPPFEDVGVQLVARRRTVRADEAAAAQRQPPGPVLLRLPRRVPAGARRRAGPAVRPVPARLHGPGGHPHPVPGARYRPGRLQTPTHRTVLQRRGPGHRARLCAESSDRIPKWLLPVVRENLAAGRDVTLSAAIVASWARYAEAVDEQGQPDRRGRPAQGPADRRRPSDNATNRSPSSPTPNCSASLADDERFTTPYLDCVDITAPEGITRHPADARRLTTAPHQRDHGAGRGRPCRHRAPPSRRPLSATSRLTARTTVVDIERFSGFGRDDWEWQNNAACRGMGDATFFHSPDERGSTSIGLPGFAGRQTVTFTGTAHSS